MTQKKYVLGIDPGKLGAMAIIDIDTKLLQEIIMIPVTSENDIDVKELYTTFQNILIKYGELCSAVVEDVHAIHGASAGSTFSFGYSVGVIHALLKCLEIPMILDQPKTWQALLWKGLDEIRGPSKFDKNGKEHRGKLDTKAMSLLGSKRIYPNAKLTDPRSERAKKENHNISDAIQIAAYGVELFHNSQ